MNDASSSLELKSPRRAATELEESLRARLRTLANHHSQAELARRTGISKGNVSRYLKSGRIPADWLQAVLAEFGVNPSWLMLGRGEMLQSEVSTGAAQESGQLLELALKLNAVDHERLSALQGRRAAQLVRELTDALARHDELRERLHERVTPTFQRLLNEYSELIKQRRFDETKDVLAALRQLERLCDRVDFRGSIDALEALQCTHFGDHARAIKLFHGVLAARIADGEFRNRDVLVVTYNTCLELMAEGRSHQAARLANAVILLANADPAPDDDFRALQVPQALLDLEAGAPTRGVATLTRLAAVLPAERLFLVQDCLLIGCYQTGVLSFKDAWERNPGYPNFASSLMLLAMWERDLAALERVRALMGKLKVRAASAPERRQQFLDALLAGKIPEAQSGFGPTEDFHLAVLRCEAARFAGKSRIASQAFTAAAEMLAAMDTELLPRFPHRAMHMRQAFDYGDKQAASSWVMERLHEGYGCLRSLAIEQGLLVPKPAS